MEQAVPDVARQVIKKIQILKLINFEQSIGNDILLNTACYWLENKLTVGVMG